MPPLFETGLAIFSPCRTYRYRLSRLCFPAESPPAPLHRTLVFVMLNPSVADETSDDPTLRRCIGFAETWGYSHLDIVNLYARVATDPTDLWKSPDPVGPDNDDHLARACTQPRALVVCAWGACPAAAQRAGVVRQLLRNKAVPVHHLGLSKHGYPRHPLYLPKKTTPTEWNAGDVP